MEKYKLDKPTRFFLTFSASLIWLGIWLTGFNVAHWVLYLPATFFTFAVITNICPGMIISKYLFGGK